jgi:hypothetical protein
MNITLQGVSIPLLPDCQTLLHPWNKLLNFRSLFHEIMLSAWLHSRFLYDGYSLWAVTHRESARESLLTHQYFSNDDLLKQKPQALSKRG